MATEAEPRDAARGVHRFVGRLRAPALALRVASRRADRHSVRLVVLLGAALLLIALMIGANHLIMRRVLTDRELGAQAYYVSHTLSVLNDDLVTIASGLVGAESDADIGRLVAGEGERASSYEYYRLVERIGSRLVTAKLSTRLLNGAFLYVLRSRQILVSDGTCAPEVYFNNRYSGGREEWMAVVTARARSRFAFLPSLQSRRDARYGSSQFLALQSLVVGNVHLGTFGLTIDQDYLAQMLARDELLRSSVVYLVDTDGLVLSSSEGDAVGKPLSADLMGFLSTTGAMRSRSGDYIVSSGSFRVGGLRHLVITPEKAVLGQLRAQTLRLALVFAALAAVALVVTLSLSRRMYAPLRGVLEYLESSSLLPPAGSGGDSDTGLLERGLDRVLQARSGTTVVAGKTTPLVTEYVLWKMLVKGGKDGSVASLLRELELDFREGRYLVTVIQISPEGSDSPADSGGRVVAAMKRYAGIAGQALCVLGTGAGEYALVLSCELDDTSGRIAEAMSRFVAEAREEAGVRLLVGVGAVAPSIHAIDRSFEQARHALGMRPVNSSDAVFTFGETPPTPSGALSMPVGFERNMSEYITAGNLRAVEEALGEVFARNRKRGIPFVAYHALCSSLESILLRIASDWANRDVGCREAVEALESLDGIRDADTLQSRVVQSFADMTSYFASRQESAELVHKVVEYVKDNFCSDIYLEGVAATFGISANYLTRYFKRKTGSTFLTYLNSLRVEKAKVLLSTTSGKVKDIALAVGFHSTNVFIREFGKYAGVSPGRYRSQVSRAPEAR